MAGWHNVSNALAAIAVARELDVSDDAIRQGLAGFDGVRRRFTTTGIVDGVRIVDDYGHHPVEIAAVLKAAEAMKPSHRNPFGSFQLTDDGAWLLPYEKLVAPDPVAMRP